MLAGRIGTALFGVYATAVWFCYLVGGGAVVLILPGQTRRRRFARRALRMMFASSGIPYRFTGLDRLPDSPCVVIANHRSYLDGLMLVAALPPHFRPVIKQDMAEVPIIGRVLARVGSSFIQRQPPQSAGRDTLGVYAQLSAGDSIVFFPEGSLSPDAGLLPFREGAFLLAAQAGVPVVPVALFSTRTVLPKSGLIPRPGRVTINVLAPVEPTGCDDNAVRRLRAEAEKALADTLNRGLDPCPAATEPKRHTAVLSSQPLPLAYLDVDCLERNIRTLVAQSGNKNLRIDASALPCPGVVQRVIRSHARFNGALCATVDQAHRLLDRRDINDVTVCFPTLARHALDGLCDALAAGYQVRLLIDSSDHIQPLAQAARRAGVSVPVLVEIDCTGARNWARRPRRTAVNDIDTLTALVAQIETTAGLTFDGVSLFDTARAYTHKAPSADGARPQPLRPRKTRRIRDHRERIVRALAKGQARPNIVSCDGNPAPAVDALDAHITEMVVGDALYWRGSNDSPPETTTGLAVEIIRQLDATHYACLGAGTIGPATADPAWLPRPSAADAGVLDVVRGPGKGQLVIQSGQPLELGQPVLLRPAAASGLCEQFNALILIQDGAIIGQAATDRALAARAAAEQT